MSLTDNFFINVDADSLSELSIEVISNGEYSCVMMDTSDADIPVLTDVVLFEDNGSGNKEVVHRWFLTHEPSSPNKRLTLSVNAADKYTFKRNAKYWIGVDIKNLQSHILNKIKLPSSYRVFHRFP